MSARAGAVRRGPEGVLGIFEYLDTAVTAVRALRRERVGDFTVTSPIAHHDLVDAIGEGPSPLRFLTLTGGILGFVGAFVLTIWTSVHWGLVTGGKAITSIPPFCIIAFEMTVLFGALFNLFSMIGFAGLPSWSAREPYDPRFSEDRIGIWVPCSPADAPHVEALFREAGAEEVRVEPR